MAVRDTLVPAADSGSMTDRTGADRTEEGPLETFQASLGYRFANPALLAHALTHRSAVAARHPRLGRKAVAANRNTASNERLEFVGDRVLGLLMAEWLLDSFPEEPEGRLGPRHAHLVSRTALAGIAGTIGLPDALTIAAHEEQAGIRHLANVLADALEAVLGAVYLDGGLDPARAIVRRFWRDLMEGQAEPPKDPKTALQEWVLGKCATLPVYETLSMEGPSHAPRFTVAVTALGERGEGAAGGKRQAESAAAADLLARLKCRRRSASKEAS
jgi:ribonuclease-3